ncbi:MAG: UDP-3-O-acyl-N-acetylglucosamine deacetylase [Deltaproteobacteria bacterium]|nr:UDP-3-O-acyl-N-acetylglucosamine deacetylase [Deltaproteobacteria bacterium]
MNFQKTIKSEISCTGIGLHSGRKVNMTILPAGVDEGIAFVRTDLPERNCIKADFQNVRNTVLATTIGTNGTSVSTVEHLMSAFCGMGIDNAVVEVNAPEVPIMDGSALPFVNLIKEAGTEVQGKHRKLMVIEREVSVSEGDGYAMLLPWPEFKISYKIDFKHRLIGQQPYRLTFSSSAYEKEICAARTFGFLKDVEYLQAKGLALGGSLKNAIVLDDDRILNKEGLRCPDEFVKHKILDAIGDLSLVGMPIIGHLIAYKSGHRLNNLLLRELLAHQECWKIVDASFREKSTEEFDSTTIPSFGAIRAVMA